MRQYSFPQIHKEEINRQIEELLEEGIVKPSQSSYNTSIWIVLKGRFKRKQTLEDGSGLPGFE